MEEISKGTIKTLKVSRGITTKKTRSIYKSWNGTHWVLIPNPNLKEK